MNFRGTAPYCPYLLTETKFVIRCKVLAARTLAIFGSALASLASFHILNNQGLLLCCSFNISEQPYVITVALQPFGQNRTHNEGHVTQVRPATL